MDEVLLRGIYLYNESDQVICSCLFSFFVFVLRFHFRLHPSFNF